MIFFNVGQLQGVKGIVFQYDAIGVGTRLHVTITPCNSSGHFVITRVRKVLRYRNNLQGGDELAKCFHS